jgi:cytidine deaminase
MTSKTDSLDPEMIRELVETAKKTREFAYAPYSNILVGAALLTEDGLIFSGCNVENSNYAGTICAERTAVVKAVSEGYRNFRAIAIIADRPVPTSPCGFCRQVLGQFGMDIDVIMATTQSEAFEIMKMSDLLPKVFISKTPSSR